VSYDSLEWTVDDDGVAVLILNRPDRLNALDLPAALELERFFQTDACDDRVRAVIVTGAGRAFCAGADLGSDSETFSLDESARPSVARFRAEYAQPPFHERVRDAGGRVTLAINALPKPVIAAINGPAVGFGATVTLAMDIRLASTSARIGFVFGRLGLVPEAASSWFLPRIVGLQKALELVYSAEIIDAGAALTAGLIRSVHEPADLIPAAVGLARSFVVDRSPVALGLSKQLLYHNAAAAHPLEAHLSDSLATYWSVLGDAREGIAAFREKRRPRFTSKASQLPEVY
jgi:enoyl-CoA hydratase/carnithine racemase